MMVQGETFGEPYRHQMERRKAVECCSSNVLRDPDGRLLGCTEKLDLTFCQELVRTILWGRGRLRSIGRLRANFSDSMPRRTQAADKGRSCTLSAGLQIQLHPEPADTCVGYTAIIIDLASIHVYDFLVYSLNSSKKLDDQPSDNPKNI